MQQMVYTLLWSTHTHPHTPTHTQSHTRGHSQGQRWRGREEEVCGGVEWVVGWEVGWVEDLQKWARATVG